MLRPGPAGALRARAGGPAAGNRGAVAVGVFVAVVDTVAVGIGRPRIGAETLFPESAQAIAIDILGSVDEPVAIAVSKGQYR